MKQKKSLRSALRRLEAALLAAGTLWIAAVTAGSDTAAAAFSALLEALPEGADRGQLLAVLREAGAVKREQISLGGKT